MVIQLEVVRFLIKYKNETGSAEKIKTTKCRNALKQNFSKYKSLQANEHSKNANKLFHQYKKALKNFEINHFTYKQLNNLEKIGSIYRKSQAQVYKLYKVYKNLTKTSDDRQYIRIFNEYYDKNLNNLNICYNNIQNSMKIYKKSRISYDTLKCNEINDDQLPLPPVSELSLHDYERLGKKSIIQYQQTSNDIILEKMSDLDIESLGMINIESLRKIFGSSNYLHGASKILTTQLKNYKILGNKLDDMKNLMFGEIINKDFSDAVPEFMLSYNSPNHLKGYLARKWNVEPSWVRNTMVGWRRKIDKFMPIRYQNEPIPGLMSDYAKEIITQLSVSICSDIN